ncbi:MAG: S41 family peptidase [Vicinamibacterales bacterium]
MSRRRSASVVLFAALTSISLPAQTPALAKEERARAKEMLATMKDAVKTIYYDPAYRGIDLNAHFAEAEAKLADATSISQLHLLIAQAMLRFGDSHTYFIPPTRPVTVDYGWTMQMIGDSCFVVTVTPGSDAEARGVRPGDRLLRVGTFTPTREGLWIAQYRYNVLAPESKLSVVVQTPGAPARQIELAAKLVQGQRSITLDIDSLQRTLDQEANRARQFRNHTARVGDISVWKLSGFDFDPGDMDRTVKGATKDATSLVLDLRGNGGGFVKSLEFLTGYFFDHDVKIADLKARKSTRGLTARKRSPQFTGKMVVLVDSQSASAAEMLARLLQIEKRAVVVGDRTSGLTMQARMVPAAVRTVDGFIPYGAAISDAEPLMADGKSLEGVGVTPDELLLPTQADLAASRDPVLSRAVTLLGGTLDPVAAGKLFGARQNSAKWLEPCPLPRS